MFRIIMRMLLAAAISASLTLGMAPAAESVIAPSSVELSASPLPSEPCPNNHERDCNGIVPPGMGTFCPTSDPAGKKPENEGCIPGPKFPELPPGMGKACPNSDPAGMSPQNKGCFPRGLGKVCPKSDPTGKYAVDKGCLPRVFG